MPEEHYANKIQKMERALDKFLDLCYKLNQAATDLNLECYPLGCSLPRSFNEELKDANFVLSQVQETINFLMENSTPKAV